MKEIFTSNPTRQSLERASHLDDLPGADKLDEVSSGKRKREEGKGLALEDNRFRVGSGHSASPPANRSAQVAPSLHRIVRASIYRWDVGLKTTSKGAVPAIKQLPLPELSSNSSNPEHLLNDRRTWKNTHTHKAATEEKM